jgi:hypothetical protein
MNFLYYIVDGMKRQHKSAFIETISEHMITIEILTIQNKNLEEKIKKYQKQIFDKNNIISNLNDEIKKSDEKDIYMTNFLNDNGFSNPEQLLEFITENKNKSYIIDISNIYDYNILMKNPLYKSLNEVNSGLVKEIKQLKNNKYEKITDNINEDDIIIDYNLSIFDKKNNEDYYTNYIINNSIYNNKINYKSNIKNNTITTTNIIIPQKVTLNKPFYDKYINELLKKNDILKLNNKEYENRFIINSYKDYIEDLYLDNEVYDNQWIIYHYNSNNKKNTKKVNVEKKRKKYNKTNQLEIVNSILDKSTKKVKNTKFYNIKIERNKSLIKLYSYLYNNKEEIKNEDKEDLIIDENIRDLNSSRFNKCCNIYNKIYNNDKIFSSNYIFTPGTFEKINDKSIDLLIYKLELLCNNEDIDKIRKIDEIPEEGIHNIENINILESLNIKLL